MKNKLAEFIAALFADNRLPAPQVPTSVEYTYERIGQYYYLYQGRQCLWNACDATGVIEYCIEKFGVRPTFKPFTVAVII